MRKEKLQQMATKFFDEAIVIAKTKKQRNYLYKYKLRLY